MDITHPWEEALMPIGNTKTILECSLIQESVLAKLLVFDITWAINATEDLLLSEYADDTVLFLQGDEENLQRAEHLVEDFCQAAGAKINWNKTQGLWFSEQEKPGWQPHADFTWVPDGTTFKYLGFTMGRSIPKGAQLSHVQAKISDVEPMEVEPMESS